MPPPCSPQDDNHARSAFGEFAITTVPTYNHLEMVAHAATTSAIVQCGHSAEPAS